MPGLSSLAVAIGETNGSGLIWPTKPSGLDLLRDGVWQSARRPSTLRPTGRPALTRPALGARLSRRLRQAQLHFRSLRLIRRRTFFTRPACGVWPAFCSALLRSAFAVCFRFRFRPGALARPAPSRAGFSISLGRGYRGTLSGLCALVGSQSRQPRNPDSIRYLRSDGCFRKIFNVLGAQHARGFRL